MEAKSLEAVPPSHNTSGGPQKKIDMGQKMEGGGGVGVIKEEKKNTTSFETLKRAEEEEGGTIRKPAMNKAWQQQEEDRCCCLLFTEAQRRELHHQVLTFNYFAYNLPLPLPLPLPHPHHHLVLPFGSGFGVFHKQFPSYMSGEYNHYQCFDYGSMMDPEPNRCRRTDGKKWRCSKNTVPYHKYCERHVHRGRNRSRKPVETSKVVNSNSITKPCSKLHTTIASNTKSAVSIPTPKVTNFGNRTSVASDNRSSRDLCKKDNQIKNCVGYSISVMSSGKGSVTNDSNCISAGIGFSPRSVLQVSGCNSSHHNYTNSTELEPGRCRRTDGKKWRCKSAVLPGQKYCTTHVHRGAKRRCSTDHEPVTTTPTPTPRYANTNSRPIYSAANRTTISEARKTVCTVPNTKLSMSIPASAPLRHNNGKSPNRSSDTDTTITDTINECSYASF